MAKAEPMFNININTSYETTQGCGLGGGFGSSRGSGVESLNGSGVSGYSDGTGLGKGEGDGEAKACGNAWGLPMRESPTMRRYSEQGRILPEQYREDI